MYQPAISITSETAGQRLLALCSQDWAGAPGHRMTRFENALFEDCIAIGSSSSNFKPYHAKAVRTVIEAKNPELIQRLLAADLSKTLLLEERDIVSTVILSMGRRFGETDSTKLITAIELAMSHGASVQSLDEDENSPLVLACRRGSFDLFQFLIGAGQAGYTSETNDLSALASYNTHSLLQAAWQGLLTSEVSAPADYFWKSDLEKTWCRIVVSLLDANKTYSRDDPCLITLLHMACFQGHFIYVRKFLDYGVNMNVPADFFDERVNVYGSAIHAAAAGGHQKVIKHLLSRGAEPNRKLPCNLPIPFAWKAPKSCTPFEVILVCEHDLEIGKALGIKNNEYELLLERSAEEGHIDFMKRLIDIGTKLNEVPDTRHLKAVQLLQVNGSKIDCVRLQRHAVNEGCVDILQYLIDAFGLTVPPQELLEMVGSVLSRDMLEYLVHKHGLDVNQVFYDATENYATNLLQAACRKRDYLSVELLLKEGADPNCPGLPETAPEFIRRMRDNLNEWDFSFDYFVKKISTYPPFSQILTTDTIFSETLSDSATETSASGESGMDVYPALTKADDMPIENDSTFARHSYTHQVVSTVGKSFQGAHGLFQHTSLKGLGAIRLVEIQPSQNSEDFIVCHLKHSNLASRPKYDALSYVWGDKSGQTSISVNGFKLGITDNLWSALYSLRHKTEPKSMWIDAICINQEDIEERNQQVTMMGDIYRNANHVCIWLGEESEDSHLVFEHINKLSSNRHPDRGLRLYEGRTGEAFDKLCARPWFFRTWVIQEFALSRQATVMCGRDAANWHDFLSPMSWETEMSHPLIGDNNRGRLNQLRHIGRMPGGVLGYSRSCYATNPKDRVFGLLGLLDHLELKVDYNLELVDIFREFTRAIIESSWNIGILHSCGTQRLVPGLPTWVPDYSVMNPIGEMDTDYNIYEGGDREYILTETDGTQSVWKTSAYPHSNLPGIKFHGSALTIKGKRVERIIAIGDELCATAEYAHGTDKFKQVIKGWESLATALLSKKRFRHRVSQAFLSTLTGDDEAPLANRPNKDWLGYSNLWHWYRRFGSGVLREAEEAYARDNGLPFEWPIKDSDEEDEGATVENLSNKISRASYGRRLFITDEGSIGLAAPRSRANDEMVYLPSGRYPFALRKREDGDWALMGDCFLYDFNVYKLFEKSDLVVEEFTIR
jgi:ankyrin repeat protein